jgi:hypothetical protein
MLKLNKAKLEQGDIEILGITEFGVPLDPDSEFAKGGSNSSLW